MDFRIADTFTAALTKLPAADQKSAKLSVMDLQLDPTAPGLQMHRIDKSRDPNFWSARVSRDIRLVLHKTGASLLVAFVGHHDEAYAWAQRRRIEAHPKTGAMQIVELREPVVEVAPAMAWAAEAPAAFEAAPAALLFDRLTPEVLLGVGVPADWIEPVRAATEADFFDLADRLPGEAAEALLEYVATGRLNAPEPVVLLTADPFQHPDARRRFARFDTADELAAMLDAPWERWSVFLHPSQRVVVKRRFGGPARVAGTAGTGKTVVALHRAARLLREDPAARVLLATFSNPLAASLERKLALLLGADASRAGRVTVASFEALGAELFQLAFGRKPRVASAGQGEAALANAARGAGLKGFSQRFLNVEWTQVVDAWRVADAVAYAEVPRLGRKNRLGSRQREALWPVFAAAGAALKSQGYVTSAGVFHALADHYVARDVKPFSHIVVDEAQDLGAPELRLLAALAPPGDDALFFAGDLGQRIFQQPFSWKALGVDVRGRSWTFKVCYRTSRQIREAADRLMPPSVRDADGLEDDRRGAISVFQGPAPDVLLAESEAEEIELVAAFIEEAARAGAAPGEIGVFVRSRAELDRARAAVARTGRRAEALTNGRAPEAGGVAVGTMHLAKGLEFKAVAVMACDEDVLPSAGRLAAVIDESDLDEVYQTERHLLYVACTRARDRLLVTGVTPGSEFLGDMS